MSSHAARFRGRLWRALALLLLGTTLAAGLSTAPGAVARRGREATRAATARPVAPQPTAAPAAGAPPGAARRPAAGWVSSWAASPQPAGPTETGFHSQTIRQIVFASVGGTRVRVRFTNAFGRRPLRIGSAAVAIASAGPGAAVRHSVPLSFDNRRSVVIAPGAEALSDPAPLSVPALAQLAVTVFLPGSTGPPTEHSDARQLSYVAAGRHVLDAAAGAFSRRAPAWYFIDGLSVSPPRPDGAAIVALGDSITDGVGSALAANGRWPNNLARRLSSLTGGRLGVADEGIGGNRLLTSAPCCGVSALVRFRRDVLARPGVRAVILLEGINDIGMSQSTGALTAPHTDVSAAQIIAGYQQIIARVHAAGLKILGGTLLPFKGARYWTAAGELKREAVNRWIRTSGAFDSVIDFAHAVADPADSDALDFAYDSGDHLHPNDAGYTAMATAINLQRLLAAVQPEP